MVREGGKWGDDVEVEMEADQKARKGEVPEGWTTGPDSEGVKTVVSYVKRDDGTVVKTTKTVRVRRTVTRVPQAVLARRVRWCGRVWGCV